MLSNYRSVRMERTFELPFGISAAATGVFLLYAAWGNAPIGRAPDVGCTISPGAPEVVHFTPAFTLEYQGGCGTLDYAVPILIGFTIVGMTLLAGGTVTLKEAAF